MNNIVNEIYQSQGSFHNGLNDEEVNMNTQNGSTKPKITQNSKIRK